ncbi:MAG: tetratricopeptide repeat protein [Acidobacteria bacterium]|nr:tetratricopeptide repeat protein [Acidobacteriota bacterium]
MERPQVYCQNCRTPNSLRETHCRECGTRLLLVVFPQSLQYDTNHVPSFYEDHLLERVSLLELRLVQMSESLRIAMDIIRDQGKIVKENQQQVKHLRKKLGLGAEPEKSPVTRKKSPKKKEKTPPVREILAEHDAPNAGLFTKIIDEGVRLLKQHDEKEAFRMLERAVLLSPRNVPLLLFVGINYFFADNFAPAGKHLEQVLAIAPDRSEARLLLGTIAADEGDTEKARRLLSIHAESEKTAGVVNFIWGMTAAYDANWTESLAAFKLALEHGETSELHYLIGCSLFQLGDRAAALRHFQKAISIDRKYSDAWFMQAVIYHAQNDFEREGNMLRNTGEHLENGAQCFEFLQKGQIDFETALPFRHFKQKNARILTGGARRLALFVENLLAAAIE